MTPTNAPLICTSIILHVLVSFMPFYGSSTPRFKTCHRHWLSPFTWNSVRHTETRGIKGSKIN